MIEKTNKVKKTIYLLIALIVLAVSYTVYAVINVYEDETETNLLGSGTNLPIKNDQDGGWFFCENHQLPAGGTYYKDGGSKNFDTNNEAEMIECYIFKEDPFQSNGSDY